MNWYKIFYWLSVADNAKQFFIVFVAIFTTIALISTIWFIVTENNDERPKLKTWIFWSYPFTILFWCLYIFTPSKKDSLLIIGGGGVLTYLSSDSTAKQIPHELTNFIVVELKSMAQDAKVELDINSQKEKIINKAKTMSVDELINKMQTDSVFTNILLNK